MPGDTPTVVFMHTAWMDRYDGEDEFAPRRGGSSVEENGWGGEIFNFRDEDGLVYGYVCGSGHTIHIERLGAHPADDAIDGVLVVWTATSPDGGVFIVGWYENATVFREYQLDPDLEFREANGEEIMYSVTARSEDAWLLPPETRDFRVRAGEKGWKGHSNVWYADDPDREDFRKEVVRYITSQKRVLRRQCKSIRRGTSDVQRRYEVERIAVQMVTKHFEENGYVVRSVESDNVGWDLEAIKGKELLFLEVKGLAGDTIAVQLTPNEYDQMTRHGSKYRVCVVTGALSSEPALWVFAYANGGWRNVGSEDVRLQVTERTSAVLTGVRTE